LIFSPCSVSVRPPHPARPDRQARPAIVNPAMLRSLRRRGCEAAFVFVSAPPIPQRIQTGLSILTFRKQESIRPSGRLARCARAGSVAGLKGGSWSTSFCGKAGRMVHGVQCASKASLPKMR
jgi:hypothetical protein